MFQVHKFNIGRPDNLVHIAEFVDILQQRLDNLQCLYCEKTYKSSAVLKQRIVSSYKQVVRKYFIIFD